MVDPPSRILIVRLSAIGDVVITTPASRALREAFPHAHLTWLVEPLAHPMVADNPYLDEVIVWQRPKGRMGLRLLRDLRRQLGGRFDCAIDFQGLLRSALAARLSGARMVVGNQGPRERVGWLYTHRVPRRPDDPSSRQRCLDLLRPLGVESTDRRMVLSLDPAAKVRSAQALQQAGLQSGEPYVCLIPATTWAQKHWFEASWAELANLVWLREGLRPVLLGSPSDGRMGADIASQCAAPLVSLVGKTDLKAAAAALAGARAAIGVDTGLLHAAAAVGTPTVALCGASGWAGFQDYERLQLVREPLPCSPCYHRPTCGGRFDCMRAISAARVAESLRSLLGGAQR